MDFNNMIDHIGERNSVITSNQYLSIGLNCLLSEIHCDLDIKNKYVCIVDIDSFRFVSDVEHVLKEAYIKGVSVILLCSNKNISSVLSRKRLPHININDDITVWRSEIKKAFVVNSAFYLLGKFTKLVSINKLGPTKIAIISMINEGLSFDLIAEKLNVLRKSLCQYVNQLLYHFNVRSMYFLFHFFSWRFPPLYFNSNPFFFTSQAKHS
ncbi:hypothetical protein FNN84_21210 [Salmonella enterica subsp. salamae]|uniref:Uncharacterized protein n=1 Tax=Salmonella enterica subsp. salamae TaxID=59202 RepID=A0A5Y2S6B5_SALER|nr:hypothetical protein [Salmonella enterica subsp. salamae]ECJ2312405.1 hypothetical protein [Salmonella enterica subsp. salamae]